MQCYYYVYRITCTHPDSLEKYYYGLRCSKCHPQQDTRYWSSSKYIRAARKQYGAEWFQKKIVSIHSTREAALRKEIRLHAFFNVRSHPLFFNKANQTSIFFIGNGTVLSPLICEQIAEKMKENKNAVGKTCSTAMRKKISEAMLGKQNTLGYKHSDSSREKMSQAKLGKPRPVKTLATCKKISESLRRYHQKRKNNKSGIPNKNE